MTTAHGYIQQQVKETTRAVNEELQNAVITDLQKLRDAIKRRLEGSYAQNFPATHTSPIEEWIAGILKKDPVNRFIENYVFGVKEIEKRLRGKVSTSPNRDDIEAKVIEIVKTQINARLTNVPAQKPSINTGTVDGKLKEIATYLSTYAVGVRVLRHSEDEIIQAIEQQLEKVAEWSLEKPSESKYQAYLRYAVATTLFLLAAIANQAGAHISKLVEGSELGKINEAIKVITNIGNSLETALINGADPAAKDFKSKLQSLAEKYIEETYGGEKELIRHVNGSTASYRKKVLSVTALLKDMQDNDNGLKKIESVNDGEAGKGENITGFTLSKLHANVTDSLNDLIKQIERIAGKDPTYKNGLSQKLEKLKGFIDNSLFGDPNKSVRAIKERIDNLNNSIVIALNTYSTNIYDDVIKKYADDATADIKQFISQEVDRTTTAIREKTKTEYHSKISKLFADMESKVKDENSRIEKKIAEDLQSGVKGLLKRMKENIGMLDTLKNQREIKLASPELKTYLEEMLTYVDNNINNLLLKRKPDEAMPQCPAQLLGVRTSLRVLLDGLHGSNHYDHNFAENLDEFEKSLCSLSPKTFANSYAPLLLDAVSDGLKGLAKQLGNAYVSTYSGSSIEWGSKTALLQNGDANLTVEATKCATVCMTVFHTLFNQLHHLFYNSLRSWRKHKINDDGTKRGLKIYLQGQGYEIKNLTTKDYTGWNIAGNLRDAFSKHGEFDQEPESRHADFYSYFVSIIKSKGVVSKLFGCLEKYNKVGHMSTFSSRKHPCSVFEMLGWISGLHYNPVYDKLLAHIDSLIKSETDGELRNVLFDLRGLQIPSMSTPIYDLLVTITGYGDASTYYGCEYLGNNLGLYYPNRGEECVDMLLDIFRRLFTVLKFLQKQCLLGQSDFGWSDCLYGRDVFTTKSQCNSHANSKPKDQPKCQPRCQANTKPNCRPTSPLMSYLNDSLHGHLPHQLSSVGCKSICSTCPKSTPGMPCLTPLGFRGFSGSTKTGDILRRKIDGFFKSINTSSMFCLGPKPPTSLPEHFGFALSLVDGWRTVKKHPLKSAIESHISKVSISLYDKPFVLTSELGDAYGCNQIDHGDIHPDKKSADLASLSMATTCAGGQCAPYLLSLCTDSYTYLLPKHSNLYLSCCLYLPWQLLEYLQKLLDAFNDIFCQDWGCNTCLLGDKCKRGKHGSTDEKSKKPHCQCTSVVNCRGVAPTLYRYGFAFGNAFTLNNKGTRKRCCDLYSQLSAVLKSNRFTQLFDTIDKFIFIIRAPFIWTLLALWSLSLLYLLHITVVRLDVLRIRSHLRSPSSHRIAAQSLLAAARLKALANVKYFSP
ncbi:hypothetical protein, conserved [Babesia ovata]|uniref:C3H1-type domain-containing protein n=1 Tax=Babesia ovata TaxID=189622 RepID=A0A2H6KAG1_9APIC|nr:uncharacterized protein BOVATA_014710 [Babesia ovata]GBE59978.1 hypothetical protein, conserved [Babesia ovata]